MQERDFHGAAGRQAGHLESRQKGQECDGPSVLEEQQEVCTCNWMREEGDKGY